MDKPKELVELFQKLEEYNKASVEYIKAKSQKNYAQAEYFSCLYNVQYKDIGGRIVDYIIAAQLLFLKKEDIQEGNLQFIELNKTSVTCQIIGREEEVEIPYSIFNMSKGDFQVFLEKLRDEKVKQKFKEEEEEQRKEDIEHYLSLLKHKSEVEKQLEYYQNEYGKDIILLEKRLES
jgi:hypothetical protein